MLRAHGVTDQGRIRASNEDWFAVDRQLQLLVVADGMGGHNAGEVAARLAVGTLVRFIRRTHDAVPPAPSSTLERGSGLWPFGYDTSLSCAGNRLRTAMHVANARVLEASRTADEYSGMGTTLVAALVQDSRLSVGHVGDSRAYLLTSEGLRRLTRDDSWMVRVLGQDAAEDPAVRQHHPMRNALTNVVGTSARTDVHVTEEILRGGELLLLSTDGVHGVLDDGSLARLLASANDVEAVATGVVAAAMDRGSRDNCTAVVARYLPDS
jgi:protein phosphatase